MYMCMYAHLALCAFVPCVCLRSCMCVLFCVHELVLGCIVLRGSSHAAGPRSGSHTAGPRLYEEKVRNCCFLLQVTAFDPHLTPRGHRVHTSLLESTVLVW